MATIVPMTPQPQRGGRSGLQGAVGRGLADVLNQYNQQKKQKAFSAAIQDAIKTSKDRNEFVGKVAPFASNPAEITELYKLGAQAFPDKEEVEDVVQYYQRKANDLVPVGGPAATRPENAVTFEEHKAIFGDVAKRRAGPKKEKPSDREVRARAAIEAKNKNLPPEQRRAKTPRNVSMAIRHEIAMKEANAIINNQYGKKFGDDFTFGNQAPRAARARELADRMLWQNPGSPAAQAQEAIRQANQEIQVEDVGASLQDAPKGEEGTLGDVIGNIFGGGEEAPAGKIPPDFTMPPEMEGKRASEIATFLNTEYGADIDEIRAWLQANFKTNSAP